MGRRRSGELPRYRLHKSSGQAVVSLPLGFGKYRDVLLGRFDSEASKLEYTRVINEWVSGGCSRALQDKPHVPIVLLGVAPEGEHQLVDRQRVVDGTPTSELADYRLSLRPLKDLYGHTLAKDFGPLALKAVRANMVKRVNVRTGLAWCRKSINQRIDRIKRMFKWAVGEELVKAQVLEALRAVKGLQKGRTTAREPEPVKPALCRR